MNDVIEIKNRQGAEERISNKIKMKERIKSRKIRMK